MHPILESGELAYSDATEALLSPVALSPQDRLFIAMENEDAFFIRVFGADRSYPSMIANGSWIERLPERSLGKGPGEYIVAATDFNVLIIASLWKGRISFQDEVAQQRFAYLLTFVISTHEQAKNFQAYKLGCELAFNPIRESLNFPLARHQRYAAFNAIHSEGYGYFMQQGTGKTAAAIAAVCYQALHNLIQRMTRVIVVCPNNVRLNWKYELQKFATAKHQVTILRGTRQKRIELFLRAFIENSKNTEFTALVVGYDTLKMSWDYISKVDWDLGIADESHYFKTPTSGRARVMMKLRDKCKKRLALTGSPITNSALDLYAQFEWLGKNFSGFTSFKAFKRFYGVYAATGDGFEKLVGLQNLPLMQERLSRLTFIVRKEEALPDLPAKVYDVEEVEMIERQEAIYNEVASKLALEIENDLNKEDNKQLVVNNILTKLLRLAQITSGFVVFPEMRDEDGNVMQERSCEHLDPNPKLEKLIELLKDKTPNDKTIVWACWTEDINKIKARLDLEGIKCVVFYGATSFDDRNEAVRLFNCDPDTKVFLSNPAAGGVGITLLGHDPVNKDDYTTDCNHEIYYSQNWSMVLRDQSEDRAHRVGTRCPIRITDLCVPETIDEEIRARVLDKITAALEISDLRKVLGRVL